MSAYESGPLQDGPTEQRTGTETEDIAIDVRANDLVHIGIDTKGFSHYLDQQRGRILVVDATHDEYTRDGSALVRRRLVVGAEDVDHVQKDGDTAALKKYVQFVAARVDDRAWESIAVEFIDLGKLLGDIREGQ